MEVTSLKQKIWNCIAELRPKEQRIARDVLFAYEYGGVWDISNVKGTLRALLLSFKYDMDNVETYKKDRRSETSGANGAKGGRPRKSDENPDPEKPISETENLKKPISETEKPKKPNITININRNIKEGEGNKELGFLPPTREEVREFAKSENLTKVDPDRFFNTYEGKTNGKGWDDIGDWRFKMRNWDLSEYDKPAKSPGGKEYSYDEYCAAIAQGKYTSDDFTCISLDGEKRRYKLKSA